MSRLAPRLIVSALALACMLAPASGQDNPTETVGQPEAPAAPKLERSPDAVALLEDAAKRLNEAGAFNAKVKFYGTGSPIIKDMMPKVEGFWRQKLGADGWTTRLDGSGTVFSKPEPLGFDVLWQGDQATWVDHAAKTWNQQPAGRATGEAYSLAKTVSYQIGSIAQGFRDEIAGEGVTLRDRAEVEGVLCDVVAAIKKAGEPEVFWYLGVEDRLPRRSEIQIPGEQFSGSLVVDLLEGSTDPGAIADETWEIAVPDGYEVRKALAHEENVPRERTTTPAGAPLEPWEVKDLDGNVIASSSLADRVGVVFFWGTWSAPARKIAPDVQALAGVYTEQPVTFLGATFRETAIDTVRTVSQELGLTFAQAPVAEDLLAPMGIRTAPSVVVLGRAGQVVYRAGQPRGGDSAAWIANLKTAIDAALANEPLPEELQPRDGAGPRPVGPGRAIQPAGSRPVPTPRPGTIRPGDRPAREEPTDEKPAQDPPAKDDGDDDGR